MAVAVDATVGGVASNSYVTTAEAGTYFEARLLTDWPLVTQDDRARALVWATRLLDDWVEWAGSPATYTQRLAWPRWGLLKVNGDLIQVTELPDGLKAATCELAWGLITQALTNTDPTLAQDQAVAGLRSLTAGPVRLDFLAHGEGRQADVDRILTPNVLGPIQRWIKSRRGGGMTVPLVRV